MQIVIDVTQNFLDGIMVGASYALFGLGFSLIFGVLRRLNLAFGPTILIGVFAGSTTLASLPEQPLLAFLITVLMPMAHHMAPV